MGFRFGDARLVRFDSRLWIVVMNGHWIWRFVGSYRPFISDIVSSEALRTALPLGMDSLVMLASDLSVVL